MINLKWLVYTSSIRCDYYNINKRNLHIKCRNLRDKHLHEIVIGRVGKAIAKGNKCVIDGVIELLDAFLKHFDGEAGEIDYGVGRDRYFRRFPTHKLLKSKFERDEDLEVGGIGGKRSRQIKGEEEDGKSRNDEH